MRYEHEEKISRMTEGELFEDCLRILLAASGYVISKDDLGRELVVTITNGNYDTPSTVVIEVNASPVKGRAILLVGGQTGRLMLCGEISSINQPAVSLYHGNGRLVKVRYESPKILSLCRLVNVAYRENKRSVVMRRNGEKINFFRKVCDSLVESRCGTCDSESK